MMKKRSIYIFTILLFAVSPGYTQNEFSNAEKDSIKLILKAVLDTLSVNLDTTYTKVIYSNNPLNIHSRLHNEIWSSGYSIRPDISFYKGLADAEADLSKGKLIKKTYGLDRIIEFDDGSRWKVEKVYAYILYTKYLCLYQAVAGCQVDESLKAYVKGYNLIAEKVINSFYKKDVFDSAWNDIDLTIISVGEQHKDEWIEKDK
jgi:hypothetical protein